ncbi:hypothetical protein [uncultured Clostridium sp.]|uniref:hypothetical protein n=1 Tax=uncultured Clostridium sp. TaxID=59620 RepID=UPI0025F6D0C9|nr:hypothetical protein [uncultured Clostridium sp.]
MEEYTCKRFCKGTCIIEILISIVIGIIAGIVFTNGLLVSVTTFAIIALIATAVISVIFTLLILGAKAFGKCTGFERCICKNGGCLLASIIGTLLSGTAILIIEISTASIVSILSVGFAAFFFVWMILSIISLIGCLIRDICNR